MDILFAWIAALASTISPIAGKFSSKKIASSPITFAVLVLAVRGPLASAYALATGGGMPVNWAPVLALAVSYVAFNAFYAIALYRIDVTTIAPLFNLRAVFAAVLGIVVLNESLSTLALILVAAIILASPLTAYNEDQKLKSFLKPDVLIAVLAMLALALVGLFANISVDQNGYATTLLWQDSLTLLLLLPLLYFVPKSDIYLDKQRIKFFSVVGGAGFIFVVASTLAFANSLAISSIIISLPLSMILGYFLSKRYKVFAENHSERVYVIRFIGAFIMVGAALWLSFI